MRPRSIRARLTLWYTSLLTVTILLLGASAYGLLATAWRATSIAPCKVAVALAEQPSRSRLPAVSPDIDAIFRRFFGISPWDRYVERVILGGPHSPGVTFRHRATAVERTGSAPRRRWPGDV